MKIFYIIMTALLLSTSANAGELLVGSKPGGAGNFTFNAVQPTLQKYNWKNPIQFLGNCRKGKERYQSVRDNSLYWVNNGYHSIPGCGVEITKNNLVDVVARSSVSVCYRSDRKELGLDDLINGKSKRVIAVPVMWESFANQLKKEFKNAGERAVINVGNTKAVAQTLLGNDFDYIMHYSSWAIKNLDKVTCVINTGDKKSAAAFPSVKTMQEVAPNFAFREFYDVWFVVSNAKNKSDLENTRKIFKEARKKNHFIDSFNNRPALENIDVDLRTALKIADVSVGNIKQFESRKNN